MKKHAHNEFEAEALLNEAHDNGEQFEFDGSIWFTHEGDFLFSVSVDDDGEYTFTKGVLK